jgi:hypothetical protein
MIKTKKSVFLRYEFTNEAGQLEGGDIFELPSIREANAMSVDILKVANQDGVAAHITVGFEAPFYGLLRNYGMTDAQINAEKVTAPAPAAAPAKSKAKKVAPAKKTGKKTAKKKKK